MMCKDILFMIKAARFVPPLSFVGIFELLIV